MKAAREALSVARRRGRPSRGTHAAVAGALIMLGTLGLVACGRYGPPVREKPALPAQATTPPATQTPSPDPSQ
ncbi:MAG: hypothetical protein P8M78_11070 [Myxococcota bacterium]|nr:hypothetical protein [Myxococcota bacterium]